MVAIGRPPSAVRRERGVVMHNQVSMLEWFEATHTALCSLNAVISARNALNQAMSHYGAESQRDIHLWMTLERMLERQMILELSNKTSPEVWS